MDLDDLLRRSAPRTSPRTTALKDELQELVAQAELTARPRRRFIRGSIVSALTAGALGIGTAAAMAAGLVPAPSWIPWATDSGSNCEMTFAASAAGPDGGPLKGTYTDAEKQRVVAEANRFLASFDYSAIDEAEAIREWQQSENAALAGQPDPAERQPRLKGDDLALTAVGGEVWDQLAEHLRERNLPTEVILFGQGWRCSE